MKLPDAFTAAYYCINYLYFSQLKSSHKRSNVKLKNKLSSSEKINMFAPSNGRVAEWKAKVLQDLLQVGSNPLPTSCIAQLFKLRYFFLSVPPIQPSIKTLPEFSERFLTMYLHEVL